MLQETLKRFILFLPMQQIINAKTVKNHYFAWSKLKQLLIEPYNLFLLGFVIKLYYLTNLTRYKRQITNLIYQIPSVSITKLASSSKTLFLLVINFSLVLTIFIYIISP